MDGAGRLCNTTVRLASRRFTFAGAALPDIVAPPEVHPDRIRLDDQALLGVAAQQAGRLRDHADG